MLDYFAVLGVPRKLRLDAADLDRRFRTLSRQYHPDYFHNAPVAERRESLERSSQLNDAYRTLRDPVARAACLLDLEGIDTSKAGNGHARVPAALLEDVFALNEELDEIRSLRSSGAPASEWRLRLARARRPIDARRDEHEADLEALFESWDAVVDSAGGVTERRDVLIAIRERLLERNYIANLLADVERVSNGPDGA